MNTDTTVLDLATLVKFAEYAVKLLQIEFDFAKSNLELAREKLQYARAALAEARAQQEVEP